MKLMAVLSVATEGETIRRLTGKENYIILVAYYRKKDSKHERKKQKQKWCNSTNDAIYK